MTPLLTVRDLKVSFDLEGGTLDALKGVSFRVPAGKSVALVGESGSGKSVTAQAIMGILPNRAKIIGGEILFDDRPRSGQIIDIAKLNPKSSDMLHLRGGSISIIFQEPMSSLSPVHTIGNQITEALKLHRRVGDREAHDIVYEMLRLTGFPNPERAIKTYPFELSGGLRQRAMIAMALICRPALLIADEPTTALDVTIQAQILKLMGDLQKEFGMAMLMITHDLGIVANMADEVVVMYHGKVVESGPVEEIFENPQHPYLKALLKAVPRFDMAEGERLVPLREIKSADEVMFAEKANWKENAKSGEPLLKVGSLTKSYKIRKGGFFSSANDASIVAVDNVGFEIRRGECVGLVGESGCG